MAVEMVLVKDYGLSLDEIRGYEETHTTVHPPDPLAAAVASCASGRVRQGIGVVVAFGLLYAAAMGALSGVVLSLLASFLLYIAQEMDAEPQEVTTHVQREGMDSQEVLSRLVQHDEHEKMKNEEAEAKARQARRSAESGGR
jgi:uncharacterized membrane protein YhiD involved in acid resistance